MSAIFCCSSITPYHPRLLDHEAKFTAFMHWASPHKSSPAVDNECASTVNSALYAVQLVKQVNYGPQESIRYFFPAKNGSDFTETTEDNLIESNFEKLNSYKNFRCATHNRFFEVNLYQKKPTNIHHWRSNLARPSRDIDLQFRQEMKVNSSKKVEESATEQKAKQDSPSSDAKGRTTFPELRSPLLSALEETNETIPKNVERNRPDIVSLKRTLRFLLPKVGQSLSSSSLISLLCLDWASTELDLGLEFECLWQSELTISNIILFLVDCCVADDAFGDLTVDLAEVEDLVIPAMRYVDSCKGQQLAGRVRLHEIVKRVLESGSTLDWVSACGEAILRVFTSGINEKLFQHCQCKNDRLQEDQRNRISKQVFGLKSEEEDDYRSNYDYDDEGDHDDYDIDNDSDFWRRAGD